MTTENELPHELRGLIGQLGSASGGGPVPGLAPAPAPNALAHGTPGLATNAIAPSEAPNLGDPNALARVIAQLAGEMFGGASVVPIPLPEDLFLVRGGAPMSPGVSPMGGMPVPSAGAVPTTPGVSPALAPVSSGEAMPSGGGASLPSLGAPSGALPHGSGSLPSHGGGSLPWNGGGGPSPGGGSLPSHGGGGPSPGGGSIGGGSPPSSGRGSLPSTAGGSMPSSGASPFSPTAIDVVPTWTPNLSAGSRAPASAGSTSGRPNVSAETRPASASSPSANASTGPTSSVARPSGSRTAPLGLASTQPVAGTLATGDSLSHGAPMGQLASPWAGGSGGTDAGTPPVPHPHVDHERGSGGGTDAGTPPVPHPHVDYGRGSGGGTDAGTPPVPHPHVDAPDARATTSSLSRATTAMSPGSSGAIPAAAPSGAAGVVPALATPATANVPGFAPVLAAATAPASASSAVGAPISAESNRVGGGMPGGAMPGGSMPGGAMPGGPFAAADIGGVGLHEMRFPMLGDTAIDVAPWGEPDARALGLDTELVHIDVPHEAATPLGASAPARTSFGSGVSSRPVRDLGRSAFDPYAVRGDFPILDERVHGKRLVWLDNAATTQKPRAVIDRLSEFYLHENSNIHRGAHTLAARATDAYEKARDTTRRFLNASSPGEIIFVRGATEGINLIAQSWGRRNVGPGDEIVITHLEHHANIVPWQQLCAERGARLRVAPVDDRGDIILEAYERLLGPRTKLVALPQVSNALGTITPAREMVDIAHRYGACVLVDGAQAVSHMRVDVQALDCDFYVFSGHKVFAPTGIGAVFGKRDVLAAMPPWQGGGNMIADVTFERTTYQDPPFRFEAGTGNIADAAGLGAALDYVMAIGMDVIDRYEHDLLVYAIERLAYVPGLTMIGAPRAKAGVLSFVLDGHRTEDVGAMLDQDGIAVRSGHHCAQPILRRLGVEASVRASLAFYNVCEDIDALIESLLRIQSRPL